jgi:hypothetical protein
MKKNFAHFENFVPQHLTRDRTMGTTDAENRVQKDIFFFQKLSNYYSALPLSISTRFLKYLV